MNTRSRFASLFAAAVLCSAITAPAFAATPPPPPSWDHYSWDIPILQGLYTPSDSGTLGSLALGFTSDANHIFGGATFFYDTNGHPVTQAIGGQIHYNDDATVAATGIIATTDIASYSIDNGPCRGCADHPRDQVQTTDVAKFEWTGPRGGRYTVNGKTQSMVEATSGPPLVAPTDYSGQWLLMSRIDGWVYGTTPPRAPGHQEVAIPVTLTAVTTPPVYQTRVEVFGGTAPFGSVALPSPDARLYDVTCTSPGCNLSLLVTAPSEANRYTLWIGSDGAGRLMPVIVAGSGASQTYTVADIGQELMRMYGTKDRVVGRQAVRTTVGTYYINELSLFRLIDTLNGQWALPGCHTYPQALPCNPGI